MTPDQEAVRDRIAAVPARLAEAARGHSPDAPAPGEWPATDVVRHLIAVEAEVWHVRLRQLLAEDEPRWAWAEPDRWLDSPDLTIDELLAIHATRRAETVAMLDALGEAGWEKSGVHEVYGRLDAAGLMRKAFTHDDEHIASFDR